MRTLELLPILAEAQAQAQAPQEQPLGVITVRELIGPAHQLAPKRQNPEIAPPYNHAAFMDTLLRAQLERLITEAVLDESTRLNELTTVDHKVPLKTERLDEIIMDAVREYPGPVSHEAQAKAELYGTQFHTLTGTADMVVRRDQLWSTLVEIKTVSDAEIRRICELGECPADYEREAQIYAWLWNRDHRIYQDQQRPYADKIEVHIVARDWNGVQAAKTKATSTSPAITFTLGIWAPEVTRLFVAERVEPHALAQLNQPAASA